MKEYLIVEIDAIPFTLNYWQIIDYNAALIADLLYERLCPSSAESPITFSTRPALPGQKKEWIVTIHTDLYWENSTKLTVQDIFAGYQHCFERKERSPLKSIFKLIDHTKGTNGIQLENDKEFLLFFKTEMPCIEEILSSLIFVPIKYQGSCAKPFPGKYLLSEIASESVTITLNKKRNCNDLYEHIIFLKTKNSRQGLKLFHKGLIDVTANTSFPYKEIPKYEHVGKLFSCQLKLTSQLVFNYVKIPALHQRAVMNQLYNAIDKTAISNALNNSVIPFEHYTALWDERAQEVNPPELFIAYEEDLNLDFLQHCKISFADYAPNYNIVSMMIRQIKKQTGLQLYPEPLSLDAYVKKYISGQYDFMYTLTTCQFNDPLCFLASVCGNTALAQIYPDLYRWANQQLAIANAMEETKSRMQLYYEIEKVLFQSKGYFPLFAVKGYNLTKPGLENFIRYNTMGKLEFYEN